MSKYTPGPLKVSIWPEWPFYIMTHNEEGEMVFRRDMPTYSTKQKTVEEVMSGAHMGKLSDEAVANNERALADEMLRAAAPELLEAAQHINEVAVMVPGTNGRELCIPRSALNAMLRAMEKALGTE